MRNYKITFTLKNGQRKELKGRAKCGNDLMAIIMKKYDVITETIRYIQVD